MSFRPPAVPLVAVDPFFSIWSRADTLNSDCTRHWTGTRHPLTSFISVDGRTFRLMGGPEHHRHVKPLEQTDVVVLPTTTRYTFEGAGVQVGLAFTTPTLPHDLDAFSRPVTYLTWRVRSTDDVSHHVSIYFDASPEISVDSRRQKVTWGRFAVGAVTALRLGSQEQQVLGRFGDDHRIDWGYLYVAAAQGTAELALASLWACRGHFIDGKPLPSADDLSPAEDAERAPVAAVAFDLGSVGQSECSCHLTLAYDDVWSVEYLNRRLKGYWTKGGRTMSDLLQQSEAEYATILARCDAFDEELVADTRAAGGDAYADLCSLSFRQCAAAHKIVEDIDGRPLFLSKENFSNGCIATVDVTYPASPYYLLFNPALLYGCIKPILEYASMDRWIFPFAPHDLGTYPLANGQVYGGGEKTDRDQMPVEECGNMLVLTAAYAEASGDLDLARTYWPVLTAWADYLKEKGLDPEHQLCTDDFAGHLAHNVNLSLKAIMGLGAFAKLANALGEGPTAKAYRGVAEGFAKRWMEMSDEGDHYRLTFDGPGTWSQKYNLVWDSILGLDLFPPDVARKEVAYYLTKQEAFGLPLDSRRTFTKLDWIVWSAALAEDGADFRALVDPVVEFANSTPDRVPLSDWYETVDAKHVGFVARSVVGGVFVKMLMDKGLWAKWSKR